MAVESCQVVADVYVRDREAFTVSDAAILSSPPTHQHQQLRSLFTASNLQEDKRSQFSVIFNAI